MRDTTEEGDWERDGFRVCRVNKGVRVARRGWRWTQFPNPTNLFNLTENPFPPHFIIISVKIPVPNYILWCCNPKRISINSVILNEM